MLRLAYYNIRISLLKRWVYEQYDSMVGTRNMVTNKPSDAGVVSIKGSKKGLAMTS